MSEDEVGYGKPPKEHRWVRGKSGNPKGRPHTIIDVAALFNADLRVSINGEVRVMSPLEGSLRSNLAKALKGDMKAARRFLGECERAEIFEIPEPVDDHQYRLVIPKRWDDDAWKRMYEKYGPPPWKGPDDGMVR